MSHQSRRHQHRQPVEETMRLALSELVAEADAVDVECHSYDWRPDDLLFWVRLRQPITGSVLSILRRQVAERMHNPLPEGKPLEGWLVVIECNGETLSRVASHDNVEELENGAGET